MVWVMVALIYLIVGALAIHGERQRVSIVKAGVILIGWLPLMVVIHLGPSLVAHPTSQLIARL